MNRFVNIMVIIIFVLISSCIPIHYKTSYAASNREWMSQQINQLLINDPSLKGALVGISIRSSDSGEIIYNHLGDIRLKPASNMKLLTAAAALSSLGKDYRFSTEVFAGGELKSGILSGNIYLKGKGDPTMLEADFDQMAKNIKQNGIKEIQGDLIGDDTWYDNVRHSEDLSWNEEYTYYGAQVSALTASPNQDFDTGSVMIEVVPGSEIGKKAIVSISPMTDYISIENHLITGPKDGMKDITIEREHGSNKVTINGAIPINSVRVKEEIAVWEPTGYALDLFQKSLTNNGIKLSGQQKIGTTPKNVQPLTSHQSITLSELLTPFMKLSNNGHAEVLIKEMGKVKKGEGSWEKGIEVLKKELTKFGIHSETLVIRDGSGISHIDLIPANELTQLLFSIQKESWFPAYLDSLPVAGMSEKMVGGTLRKRMDKAPLRGKVKAKTGSITTVSSLSGYVETQSGEKLIFSVISNNLIDDKKGKAIEDQIVSILAND